MTKTPISEEFAGKLSTLDPNATLDILVTAKCQEATLRESWAEMNQRYELATGAVKAYLQENKIENANYLGMGVLCVPTISVEQVWELAKQPFVEKILENSKKYPMRKNI